MAYTFLFPATNKTGTKGVAMKRKKPPDPEVIKELEWIANSFLINRQIEAAEQILEEIKLMRRRVRAEKSRLRRANSENIQPELKSTEEPI